MLLLSLLACSEYQLKQPDVEPLVLTVTSPTYGEFLGDGPVHVTGTVTPANSSLTIAGSGVVVNPDGSFAADLPFTDRAMVVDVKAHHMDETQRVLVPVFDGVDPRPYDPGAVRARLTPSGLDSLEPLVASMVDTLGIPDMIAGIIPSLQTGVVDIIPTGVTTSPTTVDLFPAQDAIDGVISINDLDIALDVTVLGSYNFPVDVIFGKVQAGVGFQPTLADGMLSLSLTDVTLNIDDINTVIGGINLPGWVADYVIEPILDLVTGGLGSLGDLLLSAVGDIPLGGPFAFSQDLLGQTVSAQLVKAQADPMGLDLGLTVGIGTEAAATMPDGIPDLPVTTPSGATYQLGAAVHEGLFNTLIDDLLGGFLDQDLELDGTYGEIIGSAFRQLPGGDQVPSEATGWCLSIHAGDAKVVRMVPGTTGILARAYMPDLQVEVGTKDGSVCQPWLNATLFTTLDLMLGDSKISADINMPQAWITYYGAEGVDEDEVATKLTSIIGGMVGLVAGGALSFDLPSLELIPGLALNPQIVDIQPMDDTGLYGIYMNVF